MVCATPTAISKDHGVKAARWRGDPEVNTLLALRKAAVGKVGAVQPRGRQKFEYRGLRGPYKSPLV